MSKRIIAVNAGPQDRMEKVEAILGIGPDLRAYALVPLGYPAETRPQQDRFDEGRIHYCA